jgi:membrane peptidoglycan carboxypeptidase
VPVEGSSIGKRQPGSAFKPFLTAAALEEGMPPTLEMDATGPRTIENCGGGEDWEVRNIGGDGNLDMYEAMAQSSNVYHALLVDEVGPDKLARMAQRLGIKPLEEREIYCPLALGTAGVTPLEMASAYATMANRGVHCAPYAITRIENAQGEVIWEHRDDCNRVVDTEVADRLTDILEGPVGSSTAPPRRRPRRWPTRGKTGTPTATPTPGSSATSGSCRPPPGSATRAAPPTSPRSSRPRPSATRATTLGNPVPPARSRRLENVTVAGQHYSRIFGGTLAAPMWASYMRQAVQAFEPSSSPTRARCPRAGTRPAADVLGERGRAAGRAGGLPPAHPDRRPLALLGHLRRPVPRIGDEAPLGSRLTLEVSNGRGPPRGPRRRRAHARRSPRGARRARLRRCRPDVEVDDEDDIDRVVGQSPSPATRHPTTTHRGRARGRRARHRMTTTRTRTTTTTTTRTTRTTTRTGRARPGRVRAARPELGRRLMPAGRA